jgi:peptide alpha-N-acetyltransferase
MKEDGVDEIVLETEYDNHAALSLYESLGFIREKRLYRFYLNGKDAFRLILSIPPPLSPEPSEWDEDDRSGSGSGMSTGESAAGVGGERRQSQRKRGLGPQRYRAIQVLPSSDEDDDHSSR